jgi:hypothetical protein
MRGGARSKSSEQTSIAEAAPRHHHHPDNYGEPGRSRHDAPQNGPDLSRF